jgi:pyridoxine 4-dehydrogenase
VNDGKIGGVALSEVNADTIRQAARVTKIVAVEIELSLFSTEPLTNGIAKASYELNIPIIA